MELNDIWREVRNTVEKYMDDFLPTEEEEPQILHRAIRYSIFNGGKRIRPLLVYLGYYLGKGDFEFQDERLVKTASAIEMIHTFTLIHDDLPAIDNDDTRRGKPSVHVKFGEDIAILAGDALFAYAFQLLTDLPVRVQKTIVESLLSRGVIGGQVLDLRKEINTLEDVLQVHRYKTGELMRASMASGYMLSGGTIVCVVEEIALSFGKIFQITDDMIDARSGDVEKASIMRFLSKEEARRLIEEELQKSSLMIEKAFGDRGKYLIELFNLVASRNE